MVMVCPPLDEEDRRQRSHRNDQERENELQDGHGLEPMPSGAGVGVMRVTLKRANKAEEREPGPQEDEKSALPGRIKPMQRRKADLRGLKPCSIRVIYGTAEAVPLSKTGFLAASKSRLISKTSFSAAPKSPPLFQEDAGDGECFLPLSAELRVDIARRGWANRASVARIGNWNGPDSIGDKG
jgi:hypothetical protein